MNLAKVQELWDELDSSLKKAKEDADELRSSTEDFDISEDVQALHARLVATRAALNRLEAIVANVGSVKARLRKVVSDLTDAYDDKWRDTMNATRVGEYTSAKERDATYATGAVNELIQLRRGKRLLADVEEVYDYVNTKYRGLLGEHRDTEIRVRLINLDSVLDR